MKNNKCNYCSNQGKLYVSPWGVPASLYLCRFHFWILPFWPILRFQTIVLLTIVISIIFYIFLITYDE